MTKHTKEKIRYNKNDYKKDLEAIFKESIKQQWPVNIMIMKKEPVHIIKINRLKFVHSYQKGWGN